MTMESEQLEVSRLIKASPSRVYAAWTDPEQIVRWWGAGGVRCTAAEMDLAVGGSYRIANQAPDGTTMWISGTFRSVEPPRGLAYTWAVEPIEAETRHSLVEVVFDPVPDGTVVTITHTRIADTDTREINRVGWLGCLEGLDELLSAR